jgi:formate dehydrogenase subunit gamma
MSAQVKTKGIPNWIQRFDAHQRYQHFLLFSSMTGLFLTGFPIKYADMAWSRFVVLDLFRGFDHLFLTHLVCAVLMLTSGVYHIAYLLIHRPKAEMMPGLKDLKDAYQHALFLLGLRKERPKYGRYTYLEKFEYLAVGYGIVVMGLSGFVLWFPDVAASVLPRWVIAMFRIAHSNEAIVALLAVVIGHFFWVHFNPDSFPTSPVWFSGKISKHHLKEEHALEYERMVEIYGENEELHEEEHLPRMAKNRIFMAVELVIYIALVAWIFSMFIPKVLA